MKRTDYIYSAAFRVAARLRELRQRGRRYARRGRERADYPFGTLPPGFGRYRD